MNTMDKLGVTLVILITLLVSTLAVDLENLEIKSVSQCYGEYFGGKGGKWCPNATDTILISNAFYGVFKQCRQGSWKCCQNKRWHKNDCMAEVNQYRPDFYAKILQSCHQRTHCMPLQVPWTNGTVCNAQNTDYVKIQYACAGFVESTVPTPVQTPHVTPTPHDSAEAPEIIEPTSITVVPSVTAPTAQSPNVSIFVTPVGKGGTPGDNTIVYATVGAILGGFIILAITVIIIFYISRKYRRRRENRRSLLRSNNRGNSYCDPPRESNLNHYEEIPVDRSRPPTYHYAYDHMFKQKGAASDGTDRGPQPKLPLAHDGGSNGYSDKTIDLKPSYADPTDPKYHRLESPEENSKHHLEPSTDTPDDGYSLQKPAAPSAPTYIDIMADSGAKHGDNHNTRGSVNSKQSNSSTDELLAHNSAPSSDNTAPESGGTNTNLNNPMYHDYDNNKDKTYSEIHVDHVEDDGYSNLEDTPDKPSEPAAGQESGPGSTVNIPAEGHNSQSPATDGYLVLVPDSNQGDSVS